MQAQMRSVSTVANDQELWLALEKLENIVELSPMIDRSD